MVRFHVDIGRAGAAPAGGHGGTVLCWDSTGEGAGMTDSRGRILARSRGAEHRHRGRAAAATGSFGRRGRMMG